MNGRVFGNRLHSGAGIRAISDPIHHPATIERKAVDRRYIELEGEIRRAKVEPTRPCDDLAVCDRPTRDALFCMSGGVDHVYEHARGERDRSDG